MSGAASESESRTNVDIQKHFETLERNLSVQFDKRFRLYEDRQQRFMDDMLRQQLAIIMQAIDGQSLKNVTAETGNGLHYEDVQLILPSDTCWGNFVEEEQDSGTGSTTVPASNDKERDGTASADPKAVEISEDMDRETSMNGKHSRHSIHPGSIDLKKSLSVKREATASAIIMEELHESEVSKSILQLIAQSKQLHAFVMICIMLQATCLGWEVHNEMQIQKDIRNMQTPSEMARETSDVLATAGNAFNIFFAVELVFRLVVFRKEFFFGADPEANTWNIFDLVLVVLSVSDFVDTEIGNIGFLRSIRMLRVVRVLRIVHVFAELRRMIYAMLHCLMALFWLCVLLWLILYMFALAFMQGVVDHLELMQSSSTGISEIEESMLESFGGVGTAVMYLFAAITGGNEWQTVLQPLMDTSWIYIFLSVFFVIFFMFGIMNVVTGVFVDRAMQIAHADREAMLQEQSAKKKRSDQEMKALLKTIDKEGNGHLKRENIRQILEDDWVCSWLECIGLDLSLHIEDVLNVLDPDNTGLINAEDFFNMCMRLKGQAKNTDMTILLEESRRAHRSLHKYHAHYNEEFAKIHRQLGVVSRWRDQTEEEVTAI